MRLYMVTFYFTIGVFLGVVCAVPVFSATVWCVQVTLGRGLAKGLACIAGIALPQWFWAAGGCMAGFAGHTFYPQFDWLMRLGSAIVLGTLAFGLWKALPLEQLAYTGPLRRAGPLFRRSFARSFAMTLRFPAFLAVFLAVSLQARQHPWPMVLPLSLGMATGFALWQLFFVVLAALTGHKVPEAICLRSLNKLRRLGIAVCLGLALIAVGTLFVWKGP